MLDYIKKQNAKLKTEFVIFGSVNVFVLDKITNNVNYVSVFNKLEKLIPKHYLYDVDAIYVVDHPDFIERGINAMYKDGAIYVSNQQDNEVDLLDDLLHEIAHATENIFSKHIYSDYKIKQEFSSKCITMSQILNREGYDITAGECINYEYNSDFDNFLYSGVGYTVFAPMTINVFIRPYSFLSLPEYYATAFEEFYKGDKNLVKEISPQVYSKIIQMHNQEF